MLRAISCGNEGGSRALFKNFRALRCAYISAIGALVLMGAKLFA